MVKKINIEKALKTNQTVLLIVPNLEYHHLELNIAKKLSKKNVCYVTLSKTCDALKEIFKKHKINVKNIVFIDAISKSLKMKPSQSKGCYYVSSPGALTELSLTINRFLRHKFDYIIFDSLSNLVTYQKKTVVAKFLLSIINKIKATDTKAVFYAFDIAEQEDLLTECSSCVDNIIKLSKKKR